MFSRMSRSGSSCIPARVAAVHTHLHLEIYNWAAHVSVVKAVASNRTISFRRMLPQLKNSQILLVFQRLILWLKGLTPMEVFLPQTMYTPRWQ